MTDETSGPKEEPKDEAKVPEGAGGLPPRGPPISDSNLVKMLRPPPKEPPKKLTKREQVDAVLKYGPVLIRLAPRGSGVEVPEKIRQMSSVSIAFSPRSNIPDLVIGENGMGQTIHFPWGEEFRCFVPWSSMWAIGPQEPSVEVPTQLYAESCPADQVEVFFSELITQRALLDLLSGLIREAAAMVDRTVPFQAFRLWRVKVERQVPGVLGIAKPAGVIVRPIR